MATATVKLAMVIGLELCGVGVPQRSRAWRRPVLICDPGAGAGFLFAAAAASEFRSA